MKNRNGTFLYADRIQRQIESGAFMLSEKLPSLRALCQKTGYGMTTAFQAYVELEKKRGCRIPNRSGYFIKPRYERLRHPPEMKPNEMNLERNRWHLVPTLCVGTPIPVGTNMVLPRRAWERDVISGQNDDQSQLIFKMANKAFSARVLLKKIATVLGRPS